MGPPTARSTSQFREPWTNWYTSRCAATLASANMPRIATGLRRQVPNASGVELVTPEIHAVLATAGLRGYGSADADDAVAAARPPAPSAATGAAARRERREISTAPRWRASGRMSAT